MSLLNLSRITLTSLRRLPVMKKFIPVISRTLFASTRPLMNMNTGQEWPKIVDELIKEATRLEQVIFNSFHIKSNVEFRIKLADQKIKFT